MVVFLFSNTTQEKLTLETRTKDCPGLCFPSMATVDPGLFDINEIFLTNSGEFSIQNTKGDMIGYFDIRDWINGKCYQKTEEGYSFVLSKEFTRVYVTFSDV